MFMTQKAPSIRLIVVGGDVVLGTGIEGMQVVDASIMPLIGSET